MKRIYRVFGCESEDDIHSASSAIERLGGRVVGFKWNGTPNGCCIITYESSKDVHEDIKKYL